MNNIQKLIWFRLYESPSILFATFPLPSWRDSREHVSSYFLRILF